MQEILTHAADTDRFVPVALTRRNGNGAFWHPQQFCEEADDRLICPAFDWRRGQRELQGITDDAGDGVFLRTWVNFDREDQAILRFFDWDHCALSRAPKMAVPTRTQVEPSSMATAKSWDMPIESVPIPTRGSLRAAMALRNLRRVMK